MKALHKIRFGGNFAPPLTEELLSSYASMIIKLDPKSQVRDVMDKLYKCCKHWWELPESNGTATRPHKSGVGTIVDLEDKVAKSLWEDIPWEEELKIMDDLCNTIEEEEALRNSQKMQAWRLAVQSFLSTKLGEGMTVQALQENLNSDSPIVPRPELEPTPVRDAAFHMLWHVKELNLDREPITTDKL